MPASGRYAVQGAQVRAGIELWARRAGARLLIEDDASDPERAARLHAELVSRGCDAVLGPYGSDCTRAVAQTGGVVWNHGAAADDVQGMPGVVSVPSPAGAYLSAVGRAVARLRPGASLAVVSAPGRFARFARAGLERAAPALGLCVLAACSFDREPPEADAVLVCGPVEHEVALLRALGRRRPRTLLAGVSPALAAFPKLLGEDPEGMLAPVQWHARLGVAPQLGPTTAEILADARARGLGELDYVAVQACAAALTAAHCLELAPDDPLGAARRLRTTTLFGAFELDSASGLQRAHRLAVVCWRGGRQELVLADAT